MVFNSFQKPNVLKYVKILRKWFSCLKVNELPWILILAPLSNLITNFYLYGQGNFKLFLPSPCYQIHYNWQILLITYFYFYSQLLYKEKPGCTHRLLGYLIFGDTYRNCNVKLSTYSMVITGTRTTKMVNLLCRLWTLTLNLFINMLFWILQCCLSKMIIL